MKSCVQSTTSKISQYDILFKPERPIYTNRQTNKQTEAQTDQKLTKTPKKSNTQLSY